MNLLESIRSESHFPFPYVCEAEVCPGLWLGGFSIPGGPQFLHVSLPAAL